MNQDIDVEAKVRAMFDEGSEEEDIAVEVTESASNVPQPIDMYQQSFNQRKAQFKPRTQGSRPIMKKYLPDVLDRIKIPYQKAKDDSEYAKKIGDTMRAQMIQQQYMGDYFLPAVDAIVRLASKQDLLSSKEALAQLDEFALVEGSRGNGFTEAFVAQMYEDGMQPIVSDGVVRKAIQRITELCNQDQIRVAVGMARDIKEKVDSGENIAVPEDYKIIQKVALRGLG